MPFDSFQSKWNENNEILKLDNQYFVSLYLWTKKKGNPKDKNTKQNKNGKIVLKNYLILFFSIAISSKNNIEWAPMTLFSLVGRLESIGWTKQIERMKK